MPKLESEGEVSIDMKKLRESKKFRHEWMSEKLKECIALQIRQIRLQRGWTQCELAQKIGTRQSVISMYEDPKRRGWHRISTLIKLAAAFNCALMIQFTSWTKFMQHVLVITGGGIKILPLSEDLEFTDPNIK